MSYLKEFAAALPQEMRKEIISKVPAGLQQRDVAWAAASALASWGKFDAEDYCNRYPDVKINGMDPLLHFCRYGFQENRSFKMIAPKNRSRLSRRPKVSVLVPVYNNAQYLRECLDSIVRQTLQELEIIIINDGSTDPQAVNIMEEYAEKDERIHLIHKRNTGYGHSMNVGLDAATGKYIGIVESDDFVLPETFAYYYDVAERHELDFVKSDFRRFFGGEQKVYIAQLSCYETDRYNVVINPEETPEILNMFNVIWNGLYAREFIKANGIRFHETPGAAYQDNGFYFLTLFYAKKIMITNRQLYNYRQDNCNSSINSSGKVFCMCHEYDYIENVMQNLGSKRQRFAPFFIFKKFCNYMYTFERVDLKLRPMLIPHYTQEFHRYFDTGMIDKSVFSEQYDKVRYVADGMLCSEDATYYNLSIIFQCEGTKQNMAEAIKWFQTLDIENVELVIVDNGYNSDVYCIGAQACLDDKRIHPYLSSVDDIWKIGVPNARGDYIFCGDIRSLPEQMAFIDKYLSLHNKYRSSYHNINIKPKRYYQQINLKQ